MMWRAIRAVGSAVLMAWLIGTWVGVRPVSAASLARPVHRDRLLWQTNFQHGSLGWYSTGARGWRVVNGVLVSDGSDKGGAFVAPFRPRHLINYAVEASIQFIRSHGGGDQNFAIFLNDDKSGSSGGEAAEIYPSLSYAAIYSDHRNADLEKSDYTVDHGWHTYRLEVRGTAYRFLIDGQQAVATDDNGKPGGRRVGVWSAGCEVNIRVFKVFALS
jgi:hypothetical protein